MKIDRRPKTLALLAHAVLIAVLLSQPSFSDDKVSFNRDIRPILAAKCFACHGPDEDHQESGLRFDVRESAIDSEAIVPGSPDESELVKRIFSNDVDSVMPPPHVEQPLNLTQKSLLRRWIEQGAVYEKHWAFKKPVPTVPPKFQSLWPKNGIDQFVLSRLKLKGLSPNEPADRYTLVRRVYLDLIGLPPSIEQADVFVESTDPMAYENLVEDLLKSKHYGERWAQPWLDLARYSDTNGYEKDRERSIWPYRDWVIRSLNADKPYDEFTVEQLAGDMLKHPSPDQLVATGFHRNTMLNEEGGIDPLEYRYLSMVDRVATTGTVWLGLTTGCAQCHTHKYDPISHTDYFRLMALMNNGDEPDFQIPDQAIQKNISAAKDKVDKLVLGLAEKFPALEGKASEEHRRQANLATEFAKWLEAQKSKVANWTIITPTTMKTNLPKLELMNDGSIFASGDTTKRDTYELEFKLAPGDSPLNSIRSLRIEALPDERLPDGGPGKTYYEGRKGDFFLSEVAATLDGVPIKFKSASHSYSTPNDDKPKTRAENVFDGDGSTGWLPGSLKATRLQLVLNLEEPISKPGTLKLELLFERHYTVSLGRFRIATTSKEDAKANRLGAEAELILAEAGDDSLVKTQTDVVLREFLLTTPLLAEARKEVDEARKRMPRLTQTMVMKERASNNVRQTFRHHRGEWLSPKEEVTPGLPSIFASADQSNAPTNRLEFAKWLVGKENPLGARVAANRAWREIFGAGLMRTNGDFGVQSASPTHPELLDWLATQYQNELKWSTKSLHRMIVLSATYRQSSERPKAEFDQDPDNRLLARGPHFRVSGEMVRDIALKATAAISTKMFGRGVRPPQPKSVTDLAWGASNWSPATGADRYRRSIYTFKKRTASFAAYTVFDGPTGEVCTSKRNRSNTPLQALTVLNDAMYLELAQVLGGKLAGKEGMSDAAALTAIFRSFLTRPPSEEELTDLQTYFAEQLKRLESGELKPEKIGGKDASLRQSALAMVARVVMNLDETITKR